MNQSEIKRKALLLELKMLIQNDGKQEQDIAIHAGIKPNNASRILAGRYNVRIDTAIAMADAAGYSLQLVKNHGVEH